MYNNHPTIVVDPYKLACEHGKQPRCAHQLEESAQVPFYKLEHEKYQISDGEKEHLKAHVADIEFKKQIADIPIEDAANVHDSALDFSPVAKANQGTEALENVKRPFNDFCGELVNKRMKREDQAGNHGQLEVATDWKIETPKKPAATNLCLPSTTCNMIEVDIRQGQPAGLSFFPGYEFLHRAGLDLLEDDHFPLWEHSHRRCVPIGLGHQADLPQWTPRDFESSGSRLGFYAAPSAFSNVAPSSHVIESNEAGADKWLGICVIPMPGLHSTPPMEPQVCCSKEDCDCADEGSIRCVRQHVMEAREKLKWALGKAKFMELGFSYMGEDVAQRWAEEEENLFHMIVLSNSPSLGRNFWTILCRNFPHRSFKEIVSYYFNVFMLRKRADQNRMDPLNADSDNDEWQGSSDGEFETSSDEEEEEEDSVVESPTDGNSLTLNDDASEELDFDDEADDEEDCGKPFISTEDEGFYCSSGGSTGYKPMSPFKQPIDGNSGDCSLDQDVQDDSCTSFEASDSCVQRHQENSCMEHRNNCAVGLADYEYIDGPHDSKPWEISYIGSTDKAFDFFPTCNVLEEVFGKGI